MNELSKFLVNNILNESVEQVIALFGGGFNMPIGSVFNNGVEGFNRASQGVEKASAEINRATIEQQDDAQLAQQRQLTAARPEEAITAPVAQPARIDEALVNLKVEEFNAKANTQSIQTADDVLGTLIDIKV